MVWITCKKHENVKSKSVQHQNHLIANNLENNSKITKNKLSVFMYLLLGAWSFDEI